MSLYFGSVTFFQGTLISNPCVVRFHFVFLLHPSRFFLHVLTFPLHNVGYLHLFLLFCQFDFTYQDECEYYVKWYLHVGTHDTQITRSDLGILIWCKQWFYYLYLINGILSCCIILRQKMNLIKTASLNQLGDKFSIDWVVRSDIFIVFPCQNIMTLIFESSLALFYNGKMVNINRIREPMTTIDHIIKLKDSIGCLPLQCFIPLEEVLHS